LLSIEGTRLWLSARTYKEWKSVILGPLMFFYFFRFSLCSHWLLQYLSSDLPSQTQRFWIRS
jgi:hypothetical protein